MRQRYVLLPANGLRAPLSPTPQIPNALASLPSTRSVERPRHVSLFDLEVDLIDTVADGPALIELESDLPASTIEQAGLRAFPLATYPVPNPTPAVAGVAPGASPVSIHAEDANTGAALANVDVIAFDHFPYLGDSGRTNAAGDVSLRLAGPQIDRIYGYPPTGYWGVYRAAIPAGPSPIVLPLESVHLAYVDAVRHYYGATRFRQGAGVRVGVLDTGVGPHGGLNIVSGENTVTGEPASSYADTNGHGTHVAGLIGASGAPPNGLNGIAPGVDVHAYRVFGANPNDGATNYAILKALIRAATAECDIVNLSLGGGPWDQIVEEAIDDAREQGMLVVVAAGNGGRHPVSYPAAHIGATAVSAMGRAGTFPTGSLHDSEVLRPPYANDPAEFIAAFSNVGQDVRITAPGVGVLSTLPGNTFGPMSGTSMAAPVVTGAAASLLSRNPGVLAMPRTRARSAAIERLLFTNCVHRGFGVVCEGYGMPDPATV